MLGNERRSPVKSQNELKQAHRKWIDQKLENSQLTRQSKWIQRIAVGDESFVNHIKQRLGFRLCVTDRPVNVTDIIRFDYLQLKLLSSV